MLDALAAAALARSVGVPPEAIAAAIRRFRLGRHRAEVVAVADGITYVDDSKATNPHAAEASVLAYPRVVWVAGGLLKGASVDAEVARSRPGWSAPCSSAGIAQRLPRRYRDTRRMSPSSRL